MKILAQYLDYKVVFDIIDTHRVYNGVEFVEPTKAKYVALQGNEASTFYPVYYDTLPTNSYLCKVLEVLDEFVDYSDIVVSPSFPCLCGLTTGGGEVINVPVAII